MTERESANINEVPVGYGTDSTEGVFRAVYGNEYLEHDCLLE